MFGGAYLFFARLIVMGLIILSIAAVTGFIILLGKRKIAWAFWLLSSVLHIDIFFFFLDFRLGWVKYILYIVWPLINLVWLIWLINKIKKRKKYRG